MSQLLAKSLVLILTGTFLLALAGCEPEEPPKLQLDDLSPTELTYIEQLVVLERAKAVALIDRETGTALLDSLATAWGDSALQDARNLTPDDPQRSRQVHDLLLRILEAETDSLISAARPDRLGAPLPDPVVAPPEPEGPEEEGAR
jgi:hypothetical protein